MPDQLKVAYFLWRFPKLTETFILREMVFLRKLGLDVQVFSFLPPIKTSSMHEQVQVMMPYVHYSPFYFSGKLLLAQFYFLLKSPLKYVQVFARAVWQTWREPMTLARVLLIFPKSVFFAKQLMDMKVDHIHAHFVWVNGVAAQIAADLIGITFSLHAHAWDIFQRDQECVRRQLKHATAIVTIAEYHRQYLSELCLQHSPEAIRIVHCGLDTKEFSPIQITKSDNTVCLISVGSLIEKKGHEYLIDACAQLSASGYRFHCSIVGSGPLQEVLQERINKHGLQEYVTLLGSKSQAEILNLYRQSDINVLACVVAQSGDRDGIPVALMEAMAMEIPVITTSVTAIPELVHDGKNGLIVPERDPGALGIAIDRLINNQALRKRLGEQGRQTVLAEFEVNQTAAQMAEFFQEICGG